MAARNPVKYEALAELVGLRGLKLFNRRTGRTIRVHKDGHCALKMPDGSTIRFQAKAMRETLARKVGPVGKPPELARYERYRHRFRVEDGVLISMRTGKPPAVRKDGQCRIEVDGKAVCFNPTEMLATFITREEKIEAWRKSIAAGKNYV